MSEESFENMSLYSSHSSSNSFLYLSRTSVSCSLAFLCVSTSAGEVMNVFSDNTLQFGYVSSMFSLWNMVSVVISSTVMSSFSKCLSISPFLKKISSSDKLRRTYEMHCVSVISILCTVGMRTNSRYSSLNRKFGTKFIKSSLHMFIYGCFSI